MDKLRKKTSTAGQIQWEKKSYVIHIDPPQAYPGELAMVMDLVATDGEWKKARVLRVQTEWITDSQYKHSYWVELINPSDKDAKAFLVHNNIFHADLIRTY